MSLYKLTYNKESKKDFKKILEQPILKKNTLALLEIIAIEPFREPPRYESLVGELKGAYSRRINYQQRLVYLVDEEEKIIKVISMWNHYD